MCGISGQYHFRQDGKIDETQLQRSLETLKKRGPDSLSQRSFPGVALGHTRLSIIDIASGANQPMTDQSGRYTIVFNGEIFNYKEIGKELGINLHTKSDTEVLLEAYVRWKDKCLEKLNGFFAFAIYDRHNHSLFAARDRFGIKPFLFSVDDSRFYFASELKALLEYPIPRRLSKDAMNAFLHLSYVPGEQSILQNVQRLPPGHTLEIQNGQISTRMYHSLQTSSTAASPISFAEAKEKLFSLVDSAASQWIVSDAPLGAFLSGGVDSSIVVALTSQKVSRLKTFSVTFPEAPFHDEAPYARSVAERYGTQHTEIPITNETLYTCVDQVLDYLDEPFADSSAIPTFALSQKVGQHVRVALSGDGADEMFGGYEKHRAELLMQNLQRFLSPLALLLPITRHLPESRDSGLTNRIRKINRMLKGLKLSEIERYIQWCSFSDNSTIQSLLQEKVQSSEWKRHLPFSSELPFQGLNRCLFRDMQMVLPNDMLTKVDLMSMANSLEVRPMLLDHRIADFAFSLPASYKVTAQSKKLLLLETFKHLLPPAVYNRPKHGFTVELMPFFRTRYWEKINDLYLNDAIIRHQDLFNPAFIQKLKTQIKNDSSQDLQALVWSLITFQNFWLKYKMEPGTL